MSTSPYDGVPVNKWEGVTSRLIKKHPLKESDLVDAVQLSWTSIFNSRMGTQGFQIGKDIFPKPQIMGFFLHELVPLELAARYPGKWRPDKLASEKDIVYDLDDQFSIEIKTSSDPNHIFGNRSYAQQFDSAGLIRWIGLGKRPRQANNPDFHLTLKARN